MHKRLLIGIAAFVVLIGVAILLVLLRSPHLAILVPTGNETFEIGKTYRVTWKASGLPMTHDLRLAIDLYHNEFHKSVAVPKQNTGLTASADVRQGYIDWTVPRTLIPDHYSMRFTVTDITKKRIVIASGSTLKPFIISIKPSITYTVPGSTIGPTAAHVGDDVAIYAQNIYTDITEVMFAGGVRSVSTRLYAGDRIIAQVPPGAKSGPITLSNLGVRATTSEKLMVVPTLPGNAQITVQSPNGGETWLVGKPFTITYNVKNIPKNTTLQVYLDDGNENSPIGETTNQQSFTFASADWGNPNFSWKPGDTYKVKVCAEFQCNTINDSSDHFFSIGPKPDPSSIPSITILSPNGGEKWVEGQTHQITWKSTGLRNDVYIVISEEGGGWFDNSIPAQPPSDGTHSYSYTVPKTPMPDSKYSLHISSRTDTRNADGVFEAADDSDSKFSIVAPTARP